MSACPSQASIWPPNKKMVPIAVTVGVSDLVTSAPACRIVSVSSNEPGGVQWQITGALTLTLQADRLGQGTGRVYTIAVELPCACVSGLGRRECRLRRDMTGSTLGL